jgi:hypothetical protein
MGFLKIVGKMVHPGGKCTISLLSNKKSKTKNSQKMEKIKVYFIEKDGQFLVKTMSNYWTPDPLKAKKFLKKGPAQAQASSVYNMYPEEGIPFVTECVIDFSDRIEIPDSSFKCLNNRIKSIRASLERESKRSWPSIEKINMLRELLELEEQKLQDLQRHGNR